MQPTRIPLTVEYRAALFNTLSSKTRGFLMEIYGSALNFINAEANGTFEGVSHLEEACITFEVGMEFEPSALMVLEILTRTTDYDYITPARDTWPIIAAQDALSHAIKRFEDQQ